MCKCVERQGMASYSTESGLQHVYYQQQVQGQKVLKLFQQFSLSWQDGSSQHLQNCLMNLVDFCQKVIENKKFLLKDDLSKRSTVKYLAIIKSSSLELAFYLPCSESKKEKEYVKSYIQNIVSAVETINNIFFVSSTWRDSSTNMGLQSEDTLSFDFDVTGLMDWNFEEELRNSSKFIPLQGNHNERQKCTNKNNSSSGNIYITKNITNSTPTTTVVPDYYPKQQKEKDSFGVLTESSELIEKGHKALLLAQTELSLMLPVENERADLKRLCQRLNEAIICFDTRTTNVLNNMENIGLQEKHVQDGDLLTKLIKSIKSLIKESRKKRKLQKDNDQLQQYPIHTSFSDEELQPSPRTRSACSSVTDLSSVGSGEEECSFDEEWTKDIMQFCTGHPMNARCLENTVTRTLDSVISKDSLLFKKEINNLKDYHEAMNSFYMEIKNREGDEMVVYPMLEKAERAWRKFLVHLRQAFRNQSSLTKAERSELESCSQDWCKRQLVYIDDTWKRLSPWTKLLEPLFALHDLRKTINKTTTTKLNKWMLDFNDLNQRISDLKMEYEVMSLSIIGESIEGVQVKVTNSTLELKGYETKILQLGKLHILGDISPYEWLSFGLWLFRWANTVQHILHLIDRSIFVYEGHHFTLKTIEQEHLEWERQAWQLKVSSQGPDLIKRLENGMRDTSNAFNKLKMSCTDAATNKPEKVGFLEAHAILNFQLWKFQVHKISILLKDGTKYLSKAVDTLVDRATLSQEHAIFQQYKPVFQKKMERIRIHTCLGVDKATCRRSIHTIIENLDMLDDVSENLIALCHNSSASQSCKRSLLVPIHNLQLRWLSYGNYLFYLLRQLPDVRYSAISAMMRHLLTDKDVAHAQEFKEVLDEERQFAMRNSTALSSWLEQNANNSEFDSVYNTWNGATDVSNEDGLDSGLHSHAELDVDKKDDEDMQTIDQLMRNLVTDEESITLYKQKTPTQYKPPVSPKPNNCNKIVKMKRFNQQQQQYPTFQHKSNSRNQEEDVEGNRFKTKPETSSKNIAKSIAAAARLLQEEAEKWDDGNNTIIQVVKLMAKQMFDMAQFSKGRGSLRSNTDLVLTAKDIAANAKTVAKFADVVANECTDESCRADLLHYAELVPTMSTQLRIVASVKSVNPNDKTTDTMLVTNAGNLMKAVVGTLKAAEAASVNICTSPNNISNPEVRQNCALAFQWKRKVRLSRVVDSICSERDENGLRISNDRSLPSLTDLVLKEDTSLNDLMLKKKH